MAAVILGGLITLVVAAIFFWLADRKNTSMLRTFAIVQEQLAGKQLFMRDKDGQPDLSRPYWIMGKVDATLLSPHLSGEGTVSDNSPSP